MEGWVVSFSAGSGKKSSASCCEEVESWFDDVDEGSVSDRKRSNSCRDEVESSFDEEDSYIV
jgi:hypothetical protein